MAQRHNGTTAQRHNARPTERYKVFDIEKSQSFGRGATVQWRNGAAAQRKKWVRCLKKCRRHLIPIATVASVVEALVDLSTPKGVEKFKTWR